MDGAAVVGAGTEIAGRFAVERLAGSGGMGAVYRALDRLTGSPVAVKVLHSHDPREDERFENEARLLRRLEHPGIVRYVDHGAMASGRPYLVMEWLDGEDLSDRLARARLGVAGSVAVARAIAEALAAAHALGVVHRDLKPSNVMLVGGALDRVKLLDFGIARADHGRASIGARALTQTGSSMGTPGYMAPEQVRSARDTDARADVFALGAVLFECLTGRPAFAGDHALAILAKLLLEEAPAAAALEPLVPPELDALVARMLAKGRDDRPADAASVVAALAALPALDGGATAAASAPAGPLPREALTVGEQRLLCVIIAASASSATGDPTAPTISATAAVGAQRELDEALVTHGARAEWLSGGSVLVTVEGAGSAGDQAGRAARCALAIRRLLPELSIALVTGRSDASGRPPVGAVIDRAAALLAQARAGVALDAVTRALLDARFDVAEGPRGFELLDERALGEDVRTLLGRPSPCVGRDRELRGLTDLVEESIVEGVARAVLITAPAGAGKSRLRAELLRRVRREHPEVEIWAGRGDPMSTGSAFALLGSALRHAAGIHGGEPLAVRRDKLAARVARHVEESKRDRVVELLGEMIGAPAADESPRLYAARRSPAIMADQLRAAWEDFAQAELAAHPVLIVLEDLHWGDVPSIKLVDLALRELSARPLLVLALARPEVHDVFPRLWAERGVAEIRLGDLTRRAAESLVRHALGAAPDAATVTRLVDRAAGNAFYLEELIRAVAEGHGDALPDTVLAMVESRLLALPTEARRILRAASIFGHVFWVGGVAALLGGAADARAATDAGTWLGVLIEREVIARREPSRIPGEAEYGFRHALLREGSYAMLSASDRALGHRLAAAYLERAGEDDALALAEHLERGGEPARAAHFWTRAAEQALRGDDRDTAIVHAQRGLDCGAEGEDRAALLMIQGEAHSWRGEFTAADRFAEQVIALGTPGSSRWCWALAGKSIHALFRGQLDVVFGVIPLLMTVEPTADGVGGLCAALAVLGATLTMMGEADGARLMLDRLAGLAASASARDLRVRGWADYAESSWTLHVRGDAFAALEQLRRCSAAFEAAGDRQYLALMRAREGELCIQLGDRAQAEALITAALGAHGSTGLVAVMSRLFQVQAALTAGDAAAAAARAQTLSAELLAHHADHTAFGVLHPALAMSLAALGDLEGAERAAEAALARPGMRALDQARAQGAVAELRLAQGRPAEALAAAEAALAKAPLRAHSLHCSRLLLTRAEALAALGDARAAGALAEAGERLRQGAALIGDEGLRRTYLEDVAVHARTLALGARG
jgi:predicted ATPase